MHIALRGRWERAKKLLNAIRFPERMSLMHCESFILMLKDKFSVENGRAEQSSLFKPARRSLLRQKEAQGTQKFASECP